MLGAGFMGQGLTNQIVNSHARHARGRRSSTAGPSARATSTILRASNDVVEASTQGALEDAIRAGSPAITEDALLLARSRADRRAGRHDRLGRVRRPRHPRGVQARQGRRADERRDRRHDRPDPPGLRGETRRHPLGLRRRRARRPDESLSLGEGPRPDAARDRQRQGAAGSLSQLPTTQKGFAEKWGQNPAMVTSFADGSKISFEQAIVANATGFVVKSRGMSRGLEYRDDVHEDRQALRHRRAARDSGGDHRLRGRARRSRRCTASPSTPIPKQQHYLNLYKMGDGPLYSFFIPYHLVHFEVPNAIARVRAVPRFGGQAARRAGRRGVRGRQARSEGRGDPRRLRRCT